MVPIRLELKNFLSYGDDVPALDLTGMHTICLSGENGNGKSALLDAMTWALWGESRAGKNKHDDLVRMGSDEMSVAFTFEMDGDRYRVLRKRSKRAGGNQWELQQSTDGGGWRSLTGNNAGETEKAIQRLLRMSYDTFLNSAYLRQGRADLFVQQSPGKRKEILAEILDLSRYDRLEALAREKKRDADIDAIDVERQLNQIEAELGREPGYREELAGCEQQHTELVAEREAHVHKRDDARVRLGMLQSQKALVEQWQRQKQSDEREIAQEERRIAEIGKAECDAEALLAKRELIDGQYAELVQLRTKVEELDRRAAELKPLSEEYQRAEVDWNRRKAEAIAKHDAAVREEQQWLDQLSELPKVQAEFRQVEERAAEIPKLDSLIADLESHKDEARKKLDRLKLQNQTLKDRIEDYNLRIAELERQEGKCRICNAPITPERVEIVRGEYEKEIAAATEQQEALLHEGREASCSVKALEQARIEAHGRRTALTSDEIQSHVLAAKLKDLEAKKAGLEQVTARKRELEQSLQTKSFGKEILARLDPLKKAHAELKDLEPALAEARRRASELAPVERVHAELGHALERLSGLKTDKERAQARMAERRLSLAEAVRLLGENEDVTRRVAAIELELGAAQQALAEVETHDDRVQQEIGRVRQLLKNCDTLRERKVVLSPSLARLRKDSELYDQLQKAFGKKGVQAVIIENAIPSLQEHSNDILERLTDGAMHVSFETLKEAKTKRDGPIETLDINISDTMGTRPLEMYSGGESFRAAFAIRIGLSKLLSQRAGARLQTLIIDEGFGTQDGKGREKLIDALTTLADDFEKVIVITHVEEMKDAFATRIEVMKTPLGSQFAVVEGAAG